MYWLPGYWLTMYWLPGYLPVYWGDWQKLENKTDWTQARQYKLFWQLWCPPWLSLHWRSMIIFMAQTWNRYWLKTNGDIRNHFSEQRRLTSYKWTELCWMRLHKLSTTTGIRKLLHKLRTRTSEPMPNLSAPYKRPHTWPQTKPCLGLRLRCPGQHVFSLVLMRIRLCLCFPLTCEC